MTFFSASLIHSLTGTRSLCVVELGGRLSPSALEGVELLVTEALLLQQAETCRNRRGSRSLSLALPSHVLNTINILRNEGNSLEQSREHRISDEPSVGHHSLTGTMYTFVFLSIIKTTQSEN